MKFVHTVYLSEKFAYILWVFTFLNEFLRNISLEFETINWNLIDIKKKNHRNLRTCNFCNRKNIDDE